MGNDFAGTVEELGPDVPEAVRIVGERVAGVIIGSEYFPVLYISLPKSENFVQFCKPMERTQNTLRQTLNLALCPSPMAGRSKRPRSSAWAR